MSPAGNVHLTYTRPMADLPARLAVLVLGALLVLGCGGGDDDDDDDDDDVVADAAADDDAATTADAALDASVACGADLGCCRESGDCAQGDCVSPGATVCGGQCNPGPSDCATDDDCVRVAGGVGDPIICEPAPCTCEGFVGVCVPGCTGPGDCGDGEECNTDIHRCVAAACSVELPCHPDFGCDRGTCARRVCADDDVCADGSYCVEGLCHGELGACMLPAP
jgi:hypothetical protein